MSCAKANALLMENSFSNGNTKPTFSSIKFNSNSARYHSFAIVTNKQRIHCALNLSHLI